MTCLGGACRPYCGSPGTTCSGAGLGVCYAPQTSSGSTTPNLDVCAVTCDVRNPSAACGANNCLWFSVEKESDCRSPGTKVQFDLCSSGADCSQGLACVNYAPFGPTYLECEPWCRLGQSDCTGGTACTDVYGANAPTSGGVKLGTCQ